MTITYLIGDATAPRKTPALIIHICNDIGAWGSGFVVPLGKKFPMAREDYIDRDDRPLGTVRFIHVSQEPEIVVANMIAQHSIVRDEQGNPPIRYDALGTALDHVAGWMWARSRRHSIHAPRIGAGRAGGSWDKIEPLIEKHLAAFDVYIYDLAETR